MYVTWYVSKYDYNMKFADAFRPEVDEVTLHLIDSNGNVVWRKTESGEALKADGYAMNVDVAPGHIQWWHGVALPLRRLSRPVSTAPAKVSTPVFIPTARMTTLCTSVISWIVCFTDIFPMRFSLRPLRGF